MTAQAEIPRTCPDLPAATAEGRAGAPPLAIAFLVPEDRQTGTYFRFHNLAVALAALGQDVTVFSQTNESRLRATRATRDGVPYVFSPTVGGNRLMIGPVNPGNLLRRLLAPVPACDVYHLFQPYPSAALPWLSLSDRRNGVFAYDWDDFWMNDAFGLRRPRGLNARVTALWVRFLETHLPARCDLLTTLGHGLAAWAHRLGARRVEILPNGVWAEPARERAAAREALGLRQDALYAGMMGWSGEAAWALAGLEACREARPELRLAWCGQDPSAVLERFPGARSRVDLLGHLPDERARIFRHAVDLGLVPLARTEFNRYRLPYKLTDFLAAGTPVLASAVGETSIVGRQLPGVTLCPPTREGWIGHFRRTVDELARHPRPPRVDPSRLQEDFAWPRLAGRLLGAYRRALVPAPLAA